MNQKRRSHVKNILRLLSMCSSELDSTLDEEQEAYDNTPESLLDGDAATNSEEAIESLTSAQESLGDVISSLEEIN